MTKKLKLSDFLTSQELSQPVVRDVPKEFTYSLDQLRESLTAHTGSFLVDSKQYELVMSSDYSVYFYEGEKAPSLIVYESIVDIKKKDNNLLVFSTDSFTPIVITLI